MPVELPAFRKWAVGDVCFEDYRVERLRGVGGCGVVYEVYSPSLNARLAVKRARIGDEPSFRDIEAELTRLFELQNHPHLPRCANFALVGDEWVIASELITGEAVSKWCQSERSLPEILDVAIQAGWALEAVHGLGWVHLDVKPSNLLRKTSGMVKLVDFGSCLPDVSRLSLEERTAFAALPWVRTPQYESPYHPPEGPPSPLADLWSWGLTFFELFAGKAVCSNGHLAMSTLRAYSRKPSRLALPLKVAEIIERCFELSGGGWTSMAEATGALIVAFRELTGQVYPRPRPPATRCREVAPLRRLGTINYKAPTCWAGESCGKLSIAELLDDPSAANAAELVAIARLTAPRAVAVRDMLDYGELEWKLMRVVPPTSEGLQFLGRLRLQRAAAHEAAGDIPGALAAYNRIISSLPPVPTTDGLITLLADAYEAKAGAMTVQGDMDGALKHFPQAITLHGLLAGRVDPGLAAMTHANYAMVLRVADLREQALNECRAAIAAYEQSCPAGANPARWHELATCYLLFARLRKDADDRAQAALYLDKAIEIYSDLVGSADGSAFEPYFAECLVERSRQVRDASERPAAPFDDRSITVFEHVKDILGRTEWRAHLARAYREKARRLAFDDRDVEAAEACENAVSVYRDLVELGGDRGYRFELASSCLHAAALWMDAGDARRGYDFAGRAVEILNRMVHAESRHRHRLTLARALAVRARVQSRLLNLGPAGREVQEEVAAAEAQLAAAGRDSELRKKPSFERDVELIRAILEPLLSPQTPESP